jgi:hypothetical protein
LTNLLFFKRLSAALNAFVDKEVDKDMYFFQALDEPRLQVAVVRATATARFILPFKVHDGFFFWRPT